MLMRLPLVSRSESEPRCWTGRRLPAPWRFTFFRSPGHRLSVRRHGPHDDWAIAAHPFSLKVVLAGALVVLPFIVGDTLYTCRILRGAPAMQPGNRYTMLPGRTGIEHAGVWSHSRDCPDTRKDNS
jgi:hypothetical protein